MKEAMTAAFLTVDQVAALLQLHPMTVRRQIAAGRLAAVRIGRRVRIPKEAVELLAAGKEPAGRRAPAVYIPPPRIPTPEELARRREVIERITKRRESMPPLGMTSVELIREARREQRSTYDDQESGLRPARTDSILRGKCREILRIAAQHGARNVRVFGSRARGEAGPHSDLDLLVEFEPGRSLLDLIAIKQDLEDALGCEVDVATEGSLGPYVREQVLREAVTL